MLTSAYAITSTHQLILLGLVLKDHFKFKAGHEWINYKIWGTCPLTLTFIIVFQPDLGLVLALYFLFIGFKVDIDLD